MQSFDRLTNTMRRLRAPGGCPWDAEQTYESLAPYLLEETYEAFDAIFEAANGAPEHLREELGDVLLQVVFHSVIAEERGDFTIDDVTRGVTEKLVLRHPHVFADKSLETAEDVVKNWDELKRLERAATGKPEKPKDSILDDVPVTFSGLLEANKITKKVAKVGFDWENANQIFDKLTEEIDELKAAMQAENQINVEEEIGDLLFAVVNLARHLKVEPEVALKQTNRKFRRRFAFIEKSLKAENKDLQAATLQEMDALWNKAKQTPESN